GASLAPCKRGRKTGPERTGRPALRNNRKGQRMNTGVMPVWAGRNMRLDPFRLPQAVSYATHDDYGEVSFTIAERGVTMRRRLGRSGLPVTFALPPRAFLGVAARAIEDDGGNVTVTLEFL